MQNVSFKDMYNLGLHQNKYNGHLSHSSRASKKDRKGCKKGKIESILKNRMVNACNRLAAPITPSGSTANSPTSALKKVLSYNTVKNNQTKHEPDDPYTFTDLEPAYHNSEAGTSPHPAHPSHPQVRKETTAGQLLKNITPPRNAVSSTSHNVPNISHNVPSISQNVPCVPHLSQIKKETPIASIQQTEHLERNQNIPPPPGSNPPAPSNTPEFKPPPLQAEVKPPPKRRKSNSNPTGTCKVKQEKCDSPLSATSSSSSGKLSKNKDREKSLSESASNALLSMKLTLPAKLRAKPRRKWKKVGGSGVKHEALQRIEQAVYEYDDVHGDLHSLGVSNSESEEEEEMNNSTSCDLYQQHWLSNTIDYMQREEKILQLKNELQRRLGQVIQTINIDKKNDTLQKPLQRSLLRAATEVPSHAALVLDPQLYKTHNKGKRCNKVLLRKRRCQVTACENFSLPCSTFCSLHILLSPNQSLFCACAAVTPTQPVCHRPALPIYKHAPLCFTHKTILGNNTPQEHPRPPGVPHLSSNASQSTSSFNTGSPTFRVPPIPASRKPRAKKPPAGPATPKPPRVAKPPRPSKKKATPVTNAQAKLVKKDPLGMNSQGKVAKNTAHGILGSNSQVKGVKATPAQGMPMRLNNAPPTTLTCIRTPQQHTTQVLRNMPTSHMYTLASQAGLSSSSPSNLSIVPTHNVIHTSGNTETVHHFADLGNDDQVSEAVLAIASMDPEELANRASRLLEEHESLSGEFSDLFSVEEVSEEVLSIAAQDPVELSHQASRLLEHEDITTVLNHLPDAFDIFSEDKSSEEEELHRALVCSDSKDLTGHTAVDRLFTYLDESDTTILYGSVNYPPNGYHSNSTSSPATEMRHS